jgi:hypothetical protein
MGIVRQGGTRGIRPGKGGEPGPAGAGGEISVSKSSVQRAGMAVIDAAPASRGGVQQLRTQRVFGAL